MSEVFERLESGKGREQDIDLLADVSDNILGKSFCALGDAAAMPVLGAIKHFRAEFEYHVKHGRCRVNRRREEFSGVPA
jgi:NADH-quinone oxidoreductase subunit F